MIVQTNKGISSNLMAVRTLAGLTNEPPDAFGRTDLALLSLLMVQMPSGLVVLSGAVEGKSYWGRRVNR